MFLNAVLLVDNDFVNKNRCRYSTTEKTNVQLVWRWNRYDESSYVELACVKKERNGGRPVVLFVLFIVSKLDLSWRAEDVVRFKDFSFSCSLTNQIVTYWISRYRKKKPERARRIRNKTYVCVFCPC
jgi:hypothetical protein